MSRLGSLASCLKELPGLSTFPFRDAPVPSFSWSPPLLLVNHVHTLYPLWSPISGGGKDWPCPRHTYISFPNPVLVTAGVFCSKGTRPKSGLIKVEEPFSSHVLFSLSFTIFPFHGQADPSTVTSQCDLSGHGIEKFQKYTPPPWPRWEEELADTSLLITGFCKQKHKIKFIRWKLWNLLAWMQNAEIDITDQSQQGTDWINLRY